MKIKIIAHSISGITDARKALKSGVDFLEVDVSKRILFPKFTIQHNALKGKLGIGPLLASIFLPKIKSKLFLDLKHANISLSFASKLSHLLQTFKVKGVKICGTNWQIISAICEKNYLEPFYTLSNSASLAKIKEAIRSLKKPAGFAVHYSLVDKQFLEELLKLAGEDIPVWAFTVNEVQLAKELAKLGVDGLISDNYHLLLDLKTSTD